MTSRPMDKHDQRASLQIRQAIRDDLLTLEWEGAYQHFRGVYADVFERATRGLAVMWLAELPEDGIVGQAFVQLKMTDRTCADGIHRAYLHSFRVRPAMRNHGVGTAIMHHVEQDLIQRGYRELTLNVAEGNAGAMRLYRRLGYDVLKKIPGKWSYYDDQGRLQTIVEPGYRLIKSLT